MVNQKEVYLDQCIKMFCDAHLNDEYYNLCIKLKKKLIIEKTITFKEINPKYWPAVIVYIVCHLNDLIPQQIPSKLIHDFFGFSAINLSNRAYELISHIYHKYEYWAESNRQFNNKQDENKNSENFKWKQNNKYQRYKEKNGSKSDEQNKEQKDNNQEKKENREGNNKKHDKKDKINDYPKEYYKYCKYLELDINFTKDQLKNQYRQLMKKYHPDRLHDKSDEYRKYAENKSKEINNAYEYLGNNILV